MNAVAEIVEGPPEALRYRHRLRLGRRLLELWRAGELVRTLAERELRARYKQAMLGFAWAIITPLALMLVFSTFFRRAVAVDTGGAPYQLFSYLGLLPWTFFSASVSNGGPSLIANKHLLNKVYCPREVFPLSSIVVAAVDTCIALLALGILFGIHGFMPKATSGWIPVILAVQVMFTTGVVLIMSASMVYLRDVRHGLPLLLQLGLFATPVAYGIGIVDEAYRTLYATLNPLAGVIEGYRRTILGVGVEGERIVSNPAGLPPDWGLLLPAAISSTVLLIAGYAWFKRLEAGFADVA